MSQTHSSPNQPPRQMHGSVQIPDLGKKIELMFRSGKEVPQTHEHLGLALDVGKDYLSRVRNGTRVLVEANFIRLCEVFKIQAKDWFLPLREFGSRQGFSRREVAMITHATIPGIDFASREQGDRVGALFDVIGGYWESFYFSVSKTERLVVSRDLLILRRINEDDFIECAIDDALFQYSGWCFPIPGHLFFILEKDKLNNEIIVYTTNLPDRHPPRLYGVMLCLSGGVDEATSFPAAARVAFRYLGREEQVRQNLGLKDSANVEGHLRSTVPRYLEPDSPDLDVDTVQIIHDIRNVVEAGAVPLALRMTAAPRPAPSSSPK